MVILGKAAWKWNLVLAAAKMIKNGWEPEEILAKLDEIRDTIDVLFVVDDLNNLVRGGRLSNASAFIGLAAASTKFPIERTVIAGS